ncbi:trypco2 family protein [Streptomyces sp. NPDC059215]|uniref:trypco2 family protein n=1 Tax=unclassified Streptomyces TaxID=2593676 RepID=UPI00367C3DF6
MDIELSRAVASIRDELLSAAEEGAGQEIVFRADSIELEFAVELRADAKVKSGFRAWVVSADAEAGVAGSRTHRAKVVLSPVRANGEDVLIQSAGRRSNGPGDLSDHIEE